MQSETWYINEQKLEKEYTLKFMQGNDHYTTPNKKQYIKDRVGEYVPKVKSIDELIARLSLFDINVITHSNKGGIYGMNFMLKDETFKASQISKEFSLTKVRAIIEKNHPTPKLPNTNVNTKSDYTPTNSTASTPTSGSGTAGNNDKMNSDIDDIINSFKKKGSGM